MNMICVTYNGQMKKRRNRESLDLHRIPDYGSSIWEIIDTVATLSIPWNVPIPWMGCLTLDGGSLYF